MDPTQPAVMAALRLELRATQDTHFSAPPARLLHAALHRALEAVEPQLAARVHDEAVKSLTLSPLMSAGTHGPARAVRVGERVAARLTTLRRDTLAGVLAALTRQWRGEITLVLDWNPFVVEGVAPYNPLEPGGAPLLPYRRLMALAAPEEEIALRFVSPVVFRNKGSSLPPDDPWRLFQSYLRRWDAFSDVPLPAINEERVRANVRLAVNREFQVRRFDLGLVEQPGFLGEVRCHIDGDDQFRREVSALASYALYSGTGAKTAFGMGQTERLEAPPAAR